MKFFHEKNILHLGINRESVTVLEKSNGFCVKIGGFSSSIDMDFAQARTEITNGVVSNFKLSSKCLEYSAPELVKMNSPCKASDVWSCGVLLYEMISGIVPFLGSTRVELISRICKLKVCFKRERFVKTSTNTETLIREMLVKKVEIRIGSNEVYGRINN